MSTKDASIIAQNAGSTAATIYAALVAQRGDTDFDADLYNTIRMDVFNGSLSLAGVESVVEVLEQKDEPRRGSFGGRRSAPQQQSSTDDPGSVELNFGKYRGKTISAVYDEDSEYIEWLAEKGNNPFIKRVAGEFLSVSA